MVTEEETEVDSTKAERMDCEPESSVAFQTRLPVIGTLVSSLPCMKDHFVR